jgi:hypothetical protein
LQPLCGPDFSYVTCKSNFPLTLSKIGFVSLLHNPPAMGAELQSADQTQPTNSYANSDFYHYSDFDGYSHSYTDVYANPDRGSGALRWTAGYVHPADWQRCPPR